MYIGKTYLALQSKPSTDASVSNLVIMKGTMQVDNENYRARGKRRLRFTPESKLRQTLAETKNKISTPIFYNSPSALVDSPPTPELKRVEKIVDRLTPRKIPSKRRELLVKSLYSFGVESLDDLRGFTYEELRQEMTLYAFTGVQLKRLLRQAQKHEEEMSMSQMGGGYDRNYYSSNSQDREVDVSQVRRRAKREISQSYSDRSTALDISKRRSDLSLQSYDSSGSSLSTIVGAIFVGAVVAFGIHSIVTTIADGVEHRFQGNDEEGNPSSANLR